MTHINEARKLLAKHTNANDFAKWIEDGKSGFLTPVDEALAAITEALSQRGAALTASQEQQAEIETIRKERDLYKAIWNMNPCCWFDQKSAENEMLDQLRSCLNSLDAMVDNGYVAEGSFRGLVAVTQKYEAMRDKSKEIVSSLTPDKEGS